MNLRRLIQALLGLFFSQADRPASRAHEDSRITDRTDRLDRADSMQSVYSARSTKPRPSSGPSHLGKNVPSLLSLADRFEKELADRTFVYTFKETGKPDVRAEVEFERSGFCHLFSVGSMVSDFTDDLSAFSGMKGWRNIKSEWITFEKLQQINPEQFDYYLQEWQMMDEMIQTALDPQAVRFIKSKLPNSRLQADILLYRVFGSKTVHIALSKGKDGWFARSYFVRENGRDKEYPTKYVCGMPQLRVKTAVKQ